MQEQQQQRQQPLQPSRRVGKEGARVTTALGRRDQVARPATAGRGGRQECKPQVQVDAQVVGHLHVQRLRRPWQRARPDWRPAPRRRA